MPNNRPTSLPDLEAKLRIDKFHLEDVSRDHPELLYTVSKQVTNLLSERDAAKKRLERIEGRIDLATRERASIADERITEKAVASLVQQNQEVIHAEDELSRIKQAYHEWETLKEAFIARGYAIRELIELHTSNYYGSQMERPRQAIREVAADSARQEMNEIRRSRPVRERLND